MMHVIFSSYGNDSVALIQWAFNAKLVDVHILYSDTGWAHKKWGGRVSEMEAWAQAGGAQTHRTSSIGLEALVRERKGWPRQGIQFCTSVLKIEPAQRWLALNDPEGLAVCLNGKRRAESTNRATTEEWVRESSGHGGRDLWQPLYAHSDEQRDALLAQAGAPILAHRSMECFPCINSNRSDIRLLAGDDARIAEIESIETSLGFTSKGKPRTMFRPYRYMGATGIREIVRWGAAERGEFNLDDGTGLSETSTGCDSGFCGT
jgi:3'-phosphoadenosine 5'-phosphosulfate sulfotransferase (PAPS reductase)/FAD synthetase